MTDLVFVLALIGFFALCVGFVWCASASSGPTPRVSLSTGPDPIVDDRTARGGGGVSGDDWAGLILAILLAVYLVAALVIPEKL